MLIAANVMGRLAHLVEGAVLRSADLPENEAPERQSGYLCVYLMSEGGDKSQLILHQAIGDVPADKVRSYREVSKNKCWTLSVNRSQGHVSTFQSRDPANNKWAGGIVVGNLAVAFSGLKELVDEAVVLTACVQCHLLKKEEALAIAKISDNPHFPALLP